MSRTIQKPAYDPYYIKAKKNGSCIIFERRPGKYDKLISHISNYARAVQRIAELKNMASDGPYFYDRGVGMTPEDVNKAKSLELQIMHYLAMHPDQSYTARDIHRKPVFSMNLLTSIRRAMTNLYNKGALDVVGLKMEVYGVNNKLYQWKQ